MATYRFRPEIVWGQPDPEPPEVGPCEEYGRATRAFVSGYQRARVHRSRVVRGERRCLVANFNGAIPKARRIVEARWRTNQPHAAILSVPRIKGREVMVDLTAGVGQAEVKCEVTLDNGEVYNQLFVVRAYAGPWFRNESAPTEGPQELIATA